eukprot:GHRQ01009870.1.p1 GENE.GHRQ01009870.1~~GHRQ01009870.1.p1  ORF type:complete len:135 (+),score=33.23 GHRQ01009870.1:1125-1529(+)
MFESKGQLSWSATAAALAMGVTGRDAAVLVCLLSTYAGNICLQEHGDSQLTQLSCWSTLLHACLPCRLFALGTPTHLAGGGHNLLEHDSCLQEVAVLLRCLKVWVVLQATYHTHHMLLLQQLIQKLQQTKHSIQ